MSRCCMLLLASIIVVFLVAFWVVKRSADPYGDFHLAFNRVRPGPVTEWLNMGYWKNTDVFPEACEALALKLVQAAGFQQGARVLDIGHGSGESLLFLLSNASVPRPSHLTGITSLKSHHRRSRDRIARLQTDIPVVLHAGDAVCRAGVSDHPFLGKHYDAILALDCAYHFKDRRDFLEQAFNALDPGGSIALADICFAPGSLNSLSTRCITALMRLMPSANVISTDDYLAQMHQIGYTLLRLEDISEDVFPGFTRFLKGRGIGWWAFANVLQLYYWADDDVTPMQSVLIPRYEERTQPKPHTVYEIRVKANIRDWSIWRRYSEFDDLDHALRDATHEAPPAPLPPKHSLSLFRSHSDPKILEERRIGLETYLRAILSAKDGKWRERFEFCQFLGLPVGKQNDAPQTYTLASWLDEHIELQTRIRDVRADINKRDALSDRSDPNGAHSSNVAAKKQLAGVISRLGRLAEGLQDLAMGGMSEGELHRRTDMVARLRDDCEKLGKMVTVARQIPRGAAARNPPPDSDRDALMGSPPSKPFGRVFGAAPKPRETEETRPLDEHGLLMLQEAKMQRQDNEVSQLTAVLQRQRHLGEAISNELALQIELLDDLANRVDDTSERLTATNREMGRLR